MNTAWAHYSGLWFTFILNPFQWHFIPNIIHGFDCCVQEQSWTLRILFLEIKVVINTDY
jgi:hypothetical protein